MLHPHGIGRLGLLAVGLGLGAALAAMPAVASADDMQISIDGIDLFPTVGNTATAISGMGDMAIAIGNGAEAGAINGIFDSAFAFGTKALAFAGDGNFNSTSVVGEDDSGFSGGDPSGVLGSDDLTFILGNNDFAWAGASPVNPGDFDLAAIFGDGLTSSAAGGSFLLDLLP